MASINSSSKSQPKCNGYAKLFQAALGPRYQVTSEVQFHETRKWRLDLVIWDSAKNNPELTDRAIAVEIDGGGFVSGRHSRGKGIENDCEKYFEAMRMGYRILRVTPTHIKDGRAFTWIAALLT